MERRKFLKAGCTLCLLGAAGLLIPELIGCATSKKSVYKTAIVNNTLAVPLSQFLTATGVYVRPQGWYYDIMVTKLGEGYQAMLLKCTHMENQLYSSGSGYMCTLHGSQFDANGNVQKGPAERPLQHYRTEIQNDQLIIHVPNS